MDIEFTEKEIKIIDTARLIYEKKTRRLNTLPKFVKLLTLKLSLDMLGGVVEDSPKKEYTKNGKVRKIPNYYSAFKQANKIRKEKKKSKKSKDNQNL